jgi:hypothetical protein
MKLHMLWIVGFALCAAGCVEKEQATPEPDDEPAVTAPPGEPAASETTAAEDEDPPDEEFLRHMHAHADHLDDINFALEDEELERAKIPAYWLSRHEEVGAIPADWQPYLVGMRDAARAVENAPDLTTARAAVERITEQCQGCHAAAGINTDQ